MMARRLILAALFGGLAAALAASARADDAADRPLRVAVYDAAPYGAVGRDGLFWGASVDLWRRAAEARRWRYDLVLVASMDEVLGGVADGRFDAAVGAITITPERLGRVDFSYPTHRSGVAVAVSHRAGLPAAFAAYGAVAGQLGALVLLMVALLLATGALIWLFERRAGRGEPSAETAIGSLHEGLYWAVVTMTTVGYGDKTPKTPRGRAVAVAWMLASLVMVSLLSTSIVAQLTADHLAGTADVRRADLDGKRLAAAEGSSGAEYLKGAGLGFAPYPTLGAALDALGEGRADAVVNSVGALDYTVSSRARGAAELMHGLLAPALMGVALPHRSPLREPLDEALVAITTGPDWPPVEASYFGQR